MLQFDNYFAWLEDGSATILRPRQHPLLGNYDAQSGKLDLQAGAPDKLQVSKAMAHVVLPSLLYRERKYTLPERGP